MSVINIYNTCFPDKLHIKSLTLILILSVFVPALPNEVHKWVKSAEN